MLYDFLLSLASEFHTPINELLKMDAFFYIKLSYIALNRQKRYNENTEDPQASIAQIETLGNMLV